MGLFDGTPLERPVTCDRCGDAVADCDCPAEPPAAEAAVDRARFDLRVRRERRRGKWCAAIAGVDDAATRKALLKTLRGALGCGGGETDEQLVLQGDCRDAVVAKLTELGYRAKPAGG